jgi:hypothetical protein
VTASTSTAAQPHSLKLWWAILLLGCFVSVVLNLWHALTLNTGKHGHPVLGIIFALVPVVFAAMLSHGLVSPGAATWFKAAILALFGISMLTSISSQAAVMKPYGGGYGAEWSIPVVLDAAAILALYFITSRAAAAREAAQESAAAAETEIAKAELRPAVEAEVRADLRAELVTARAELEAELARNREAELAAAKAEVEAELRPELERGIATRLEAEVAEFRLRAAAETAVAVQRAEVAAEARVRSEFAEQAKQQGQRKTPGPAARKVVDEGLTSEDKARILLAGSPEMSGADLGRALGMTERYGRDLLKKIKGGDSDDPEPQPDNLRFLSVSSGS